MKSSSRFTGRRAARFFAVQALYQSEHTDQPLTIMLDHFIKDHLHDPKHSTAVKTDEVLFNTLVHGVIENKDTLDQAVESVLAEGWTLQRLDEVVLSVLRLGAFECLYALETPLPVIVNEYIEVAKAFFSANEVNFIHVAMDNLGKKRQVS